MITNISLKHWKDIVFLRLQCNIDDEIVCVLKTLVDNNIPITFNWAYYPKITIEKPKMELYCQNKRYNIYLWEDFALNIECDIVNDNIIDFINNGGNNAGYWKKRKQKANAVKTQRI